MNDYSQVNVPQLSVEQTTDMLASAFSGIINRGLSIRTIPSVMLWGPPGVGKSQAIRHMAERIGRETGKKTVITDVRLLLFNPIDLRGIPTSNADKTLAIWLKPKIFQMDPDDSAVNILFLDEITAAPQSVQAAAYQITLDRVIGEHALPDNCIVVAAGNRVTDRSVAYKMPKALANRLLHIEVEGKIKSWEKWAVANGINKMILGFLSFRPDYLFGFSSDNDDLAFPTPRTWEMASNILNYVDGDIESAFPLIAGTIGVSVAIEFKTWTNVYSKLPSMDDIFNGKDPEIPQTPDALYALTASMVSHAREHKEEMQKISNSIQYSRKMPPDFSAILLRDYMYLEKGYKEKLMRLPAFMNWYRDVGVMLNGIV